MANVKLQIRGREALQQKLNEKREQLIKALDVRLMQLAEEAVTYSKDNKGYQDRTANLKKLNIFRSIFRWRNRCI